MVQATVEKEMLNTLTDLRQDVNHLKQDMHYILEYLEDTQLTMEEKKLLDESIENEKAGKLTSLKELKNVRNRSG